MPRKLPHLLLKSWMAIAAGAWACVGPGPQPTPPGAHPAFDRHLAELDPRYRFLFTDGKRIFEGRLDGSEGAVLLDLAREERSPDVDIAFDPRLSPDGRRLLVPYVVRGSGDPAKRLLLLDIRSGEARHVTIPQDDHFQFEGGTSSNELCDWVGPDRFVVSLTYWPSGGGDSRRKFFGYDLADLASPRELDFGDVYYGIRRSRHGHLLMLGRPHSRTDEWTVHALDGSGFRAATVAENAEFEDLGSDDPAPTEGQRRVSAEMHGTPEPLFDWEIEKIRWDIELDGRLVRRSWRSPSTPVWHEGPGIYTWREWDNVVPTSYVMDGEGHYRAWRRGRLILTEPRDRGRARSASTVSPNRDSL